jgi:hypothetical protein
MLSSSFSLSWSAVERAREYLLDISTNPNYSDYKLGFNDYSVSGTTNMTIPSLDKSQPFFCRLRSQNPYETSTYTETSGYTLAPEPSGVIITNITPTGFTVSWDDIESNLIASYNFIGNYRDSSLNDNHGFASGTCNATSGFAFIPSGTTSRIYIPSGVADGLTELTFCAWVQIARTDNSDTLNSLSKHVLINGYKSGLTSGESSFEIAIYTYDGFTSDDILVSFLTPSNSSQLPITGTTGNDYLTNGNLQFTTNTPYSLMDLQPHHMAVTRDVTGFVTLYIDGVVQNAVNDDDGTYFSDPTEVAYLVLGNAQTSEDSGYSGLSAFDGNIDTVRFYSRCLTASEIDAVRQLHHDLS